MSKYIRADGKNKPRFDFRGFPRGLPGRLLTFNRMSAPPHRTDWIYGIGSDQYLTEAERFLGIQIINHLNLESQQCHPGHEMLAARIGLTPRSIVRRVKQIEKAGWLTVKRCHGKTKKVGRPGNEYLPTVPAALLEAIRVWLPTTQTQVTPRRHLAQADPSDTRSPTQVTPRCHPNKEGINKEGIDGMEEKRLSDEARDYFVEVDTPAWKAWSKI